MVTRIGGPFENIIDTVSVEESVEQLVLRLIKENNCLIRPVIDPKIEELQLRAHAILFEIANTAEFSNCLLLEGDALTEIRTMITSREPGLWPSFFRVLEKAWWLNGKLFSGYDALELEIISRNGQGISTGGTKSIYTDGRFAYVSGKVYMFSRETSDDHYMLIRVAPDLKIKDYFELEGIDDEWVASTDNGATYLNLCVARISTYDRFGGWQEYGKELLEGMIEKGELELAIRGIVSDALRDGYRNLRGLLKAEGERLVRGYSTRVELEDHLNQIQAAYNVLIQETDFLPTSAINKINELNALNSRLEKIHQKMKHQANIGSIDLY